MIRFLTGQRRSRHRLVIAMTMLLAASPVFATPASEADVDRLLTASRAEAMINSVLPQLLAAQQQQVEQQLSGLDFTPQQLELIRRFQATNVDTVTRAMAWKEVRPMYVDLYRDAFSREEILAISAFYESPIGHAMLDKTPALMQKSMELNIARLQPLMADMQKRLQAVLLEAALLKEPAQDK
ncbi:DUF2059 domain-containing protein [Stenotrophomonas maltophilia]|nr:DUF2059 domain-containing protein [Stenotrophomonas maltophilia]